MKVFISWSKDSSKSVALEFHKLIPSMTQFQVETWCSADPKCLPQGSGYPEGILKAAKECDACFVILTRENLAGYWINFEPGIFFGQGKKVFAFICRGLEHSDLAKANHPLSVNGVYYTYMSQESLADFFTSLKSDDSKWAQIDFRGLVAAKYDELQKKYDSIFNDDYMRLSTLLSTDVDSIKNT